MNLVLLVGTEDTGSCSTDMETEAQCLQGEPGQHLLHANLYARSIVTGDLIQCLQEPF